MPDVLALIDDLFFQMKIAETAKHLGLEMKVAANGDALMKLMDSAPRLVIIDLNSRSQPLEVVRRLREAQHAGARTRIVAFLSHVQRELAAQASAAGCDEVLPRSAFTQNLPAILGSAIMER
jgi:CheY-like chemotaxis protein